MGHTVDWYHTFYGGSDARRICAVTRSRLIPARPRAVDAPIEGAMSLGHVR